MGWWAAAWHEVREVWCAVTIDLDAVRKLEEQLKWLGDCHLLDTPTQSLGTYDVYKVVRDLRAEIERLLDDNHRLGGVAERERESADRFAGLWHGDARTVEQQRDAALARVKELEAEVAFRRCGMNSPTGGSRES